MDKVYLKRLDEGKVVAVDEAGDVIGKPFKTELISEVNRIEKIVIHSYVDGWWECKNDE